MALSELAAIEAAYHQLQRLDPAGRRRALQWLSDALGSDHSLAPAPTPTQAPAVNGHQPPQQSVMAQAEQNRSVPTPRRVRKSAAGHAAAAAEETTPTGKTTRRATPKRGKMAIGKLASAKGGGSRPYRRMPEADEVMAAYRQVGTIAGVAEHFDVPRHTAHNWARTLRNQGFDIGRKG